MWDCAAFANDATLQAGCWQAVAASHAAKLDLQGATRGAAATGAAGFLAFCAGAFVLVAARWRAAYGRQEMRENTAAALIGDISAWHSFIKDEDVIGTLNVKAENSEVMYFHPGDHWLRVYFSDPSKSGLFTQRIAEDLAYYYSRISGEIGRLIWLHELAKAGKQTESWIPREQKNCAASLNKLRTKGEDLITRLDDERKDALKARRSWFSLVFKPD
jgi:hypothetical protein